MDYIGIYLGTREKWKLLLHDLGFRGLVQLSMAVSRETRTSWQEQSA